MPYLTNAVSSAQDFAQNTMKSAAKHDLARCDAYNYQENKQLGLGSPWSHMSQIHNNL